MEKQLIDEFIEYAEQTFGVNITIEESSDYDTFDKIFGELPGELTVGLYRNESLQCDNTMTAVNPTKYDTSKELIRAA